MSAISFVSPHVDDQTQTVLVKGQVVVDHGQHTGAKPGMVLYGPGTSTP